jgi:RNA polymerase sigma-70 factor (ECF subfamily)
MQTELVQRAMAGDHDAFAALVGAAWPKLYATAGFILGEEGYVQEAIQAALIRAWRDLPSLRDAARFEGWLYRIAINACRDEARRRQRGRQREIALDGHDPAASVDPVAWLAERDEMDRAFARLTPDQRAILTLVFYRDLTVPQAADAIGIRLGTAKSRLHRALAALRAALAAEQRQGMQREVRT